MSETPIFDQLAREMGYNRMVAGGPTLRLRPSTFRSKGQTDKTVNAAPNSNSSIQGHAPKVAYVDELQLGAEPDDEVIVFKTHIPVTTLASLAQGTQQE